MTDAGQYIGAKQPHRFQRLISAQTRPGETEVDDSDSGGLVEVGDLLHHRVGAAAELQRAEGEADSTLIGAVFLPSASVPTVTGTGGAGGATAAPRPRKSCRGEPELKNAACSVAASSSFSPTPINAR